MHRIRPYLEPAVLIHRESTTLFSPGARFKQKTGAIPRFRAVLC
jgi:hypothetical protein